MREDKEDIKLGNEPTGEEANQDIVHPKQLGNKIPHITESDKHTPITGIQSAIIREVMTSELLDPPSQDYSVEAEILARGANNKSQRTANDVVMSNILLQLANLTNEITILKKTSTEQLGINRKQAKININQARINTELATAFDEQATTIKDLVDKNDKLYNDIQSLKALTANSNKKIDILINLLNINI
jgi:hypothetical protein